MMTTPQPVTQKRSAEESAIDHANGVHDPLAVDPLAKKAKHGEIVSNENSNFIDTELQTTNGGGVEVPKPRSPRRSASPARDLRPVEEQKARSPSPIKNVAAADPSLSTTTAAAATSFAPPPPKSTDSPMSASVKAPEAEVPALPTGDGAHSMPVQDQSPAAPPTVSGPETNDAEMMDAETKPVKQEPHMVPVTREEVLPNPANPAVKFVYLVTEYPSLKLGPQEPLAEDATEEDRELLKEQMKFTQQALRQLKKHRPSIDPFLHPVDPVALGIPQYADIIKQPMDVSTIEKKFAAKEYEIPQQFINDVYLMLNNCFTFNQQSHSVYGFGLKIKSWFDLYMSRMPFTLTKAAPPSTVKKNLDLDMRPKREVHPPSRDLLAPSPLSATPKLSATPASVHSGAVNGVNGHGAPAPSGSGAPPSSNKHGQQSNNSLKFCSKVLRELMGPKYANINNIFLLPVDPVALGVPDYFDVIKHPMDLSTIKRKMDTHMYTSADDFEDDVRLMIRNCLKFNNPGDFVYNTGLEFQRVFDSKMKHTAENVAEDDGEDEIDTAEENRLKIEMNVVEEQMAELQSKLNGLKEKLGQITRKRRPSGASSAHSSKKHGTAVKSRGSSGSHVHKTPKNAVMHHTHLFSSNTKGSSSTTASGKKSGASHNRGKVPLGRPPLVEKDRRPLSLEQKQELSEAVARLEEHKLARVVDMIRESMPSLFGGSDEIELDIDKIDDSTQRALYNFAVKGQESKKKSGDASRIEALQGALTEFNASAKKQAHYSSESEGSEHGSEYDSE